MRKKFFKNKRIATKETLLLVVLFLILFVYFISKPAIFSPDTYSYFNAIIYRFPGYVLFLRSIEIIFKGYFDVVAVACQLLFGFYAILVLFKNCSTLFKLNWWQKLILLTIFIIPYFQPLLVGNNLASEGISYPLYLLLLSYSFDFLFNDKYNKIIHFSIVFIALTLTRGQFILVAPILAFVYILKEKRQIIQRKNLLYLLIILLLPFTSKLLDSSYRKIFHGFFVATPYSYSNAFALPLFVSKLSDSSAIKNSDDRHLFIVSYNTIDSLGLLSRRIEGDALDRYKPFHDNFPIIFNQNFYSKARLYFLNKNGIPMKNSITAENSAKSMLPVLVSNNWNEYLTLYFAGIRHGFKSIILIIFIVILLFYSLWETSKKFSLANGILLFSSLLIISNSMLVAFASHSIARYLFYNYFFVLIIAIVLSRKIAQKL